MLQIKAVLVPDQGGVSVVMMGVTALLVVLPFFGLHQSMAILLLGIVDYIMNQIKLNVMLGIGATGFRFVV